MELRKVPRVRKVDMRQIERESRGIMKPGQDLVVAGYAGLEGSRRIARAREQELLHWFSGEYIRQMQELADVELDTDPDCWRKLGASEWEEVGEGGIHTALWNLSGAYMTGFEVNLHLIPVKQETIEVCERYDLNPYDLYSSNCMLLVADNGGHLVKALAERGIPAECIGVVNRGIKREICYGEVHGFMDRPKKDELYRILDQEAAQ